MVYLRVPDALKQALAVRARERSLNLTAAVVALLERGLMRAPRRAHAPGKLSSRRPPAELERTRARLPEAEAALAWPESGSSYTRASGVAERARGELAVLSPVRKPVRGCDLLVRGHCPNCAGRSRPCCSRVHRPAPPIETPTWRCSVRSAASSAWHWQAPAAARLRGPVAENESARHAPPRPNSAPAHLSQIAGSATPGFRPGRLRPPRETIRPPSNGPV